MGPNGKSNQYDMCWSSLEASSTERCGLCLSWFNKVHSFISNIYIAPLQEVYSEALSVQLRPKRNALRSLLKEDTLFRGSKRNVRGSWSHVEGPITENARRCLSAESIRGTKSSPRAEERSARREAKSETGLQKTKFSRQRRHSIHI